MKLILIRGLPGSGKTTLATEMAKQVGAVHLESDHYMQSGDFYHYDRSWIRQAHQRCHRLANAALDAGRHVIVANTFTQLWEMDSYFNIAKGNLMIDVEVVTCTGEFGSIYDVPEEVMERMAKRWEDYEHEIVYDS